MAVERGHDYQQQQQNAATVPGAPRNVRSTAIYTLALLYAFIVGSPITRKSGYDVGLIRLPLSSFACQSGFLARCAREQPQTKLLARESTFKRGNRFLERASPIPSSRYALQTFPINQ